MTGGPDYLLGVRPEVCLRPVVVPDQVRELQELPVQRGVAVPPRRAPLLGLLHGHRLGGEPGIVGVLGAYLDVRVADYLALVNR